MNRLLIVVTGHHRLGETGRATGVWFEEFAVPYYHWLDLGWRLTVASPAGGEAPVDPASLKESAPGLLRRYAAEPERPLEHTVPLAALRAADFDAVFYPGGHGPMWDLATDSRSARLLDEFLNGGKVVAAVCHGLAALTAPADHSRRPPVEGRRITGFSNREETLAGLDAAVPFHLEDRLKAEGGRYSSGEPWQEFVIVDGRLVTGQNPASSALLARKVAELLTPL